MWKNVDSITGQTNRYYYISDTPAGAIMGTQRKDFFEIVEKIIGFDNYNSIFMGDDKICYLTNNDYVINFNDYVSENLAKKYVGNDGDAFVLVSDYKKDSVLIRTEIPALMDKTSVKLINGIPKEALKEYYNMFRDLSDKNIASEKVVSVLSTIAEEQLSKISLIDLIQTQIQDLKNKYGEEVISKIVSNNGIITDTSNWLSDVENSLYELGNRLDISDALRNDINAIIKKKMRRALV